jgi:hypothetical protein
VIQGFQGQSLVDRSGHRGFLWWRLLRFTLTILILRSGLPQFSTVFFLARKEDGRIWSPNYEMMECIFGFTLKLCFLLWYCMLSFGWNQDCPEKYAHNYTYLVGGLEHGFYFSIHIGNVIIPSDELTVVPVVPWPKRDHHGQAFLRRSTFENATNDKYDCMMYT